jgi:hypothetical protein
MDSPIIRQKDVNNYPCPRCGADRSCQFRYREQWCKKCGHIKTGIKRDARTEKECLVCGKEILIPRCLMTVKKFCSIDCRIKWQRRNFVEKVLLTKEQKSAILRKAHLGYKMPQSQKDKIRKALKGKSCKANIGKSPWNKGLKLASISPKREDDYRMRKLFRSRIQTQVFERDNYTCQICGVRGVKLQVDHIQSWSEYVELRFNLDNCRTLCQGCHYQITFGKLMPLTVKAWGHNFKYVERGGLP